VELERLHRERNRLNPQNAEIVCFENGIELVRFPYSKKLARKLGASLPPLTVTTPKGTEVLGKPAPPDLRPGATPVEQLLVKKCGTEGLTEEEIFSLVFDELRWVEKSRGARVSLRKLLKRMVKEGKLILAHGKYHMGYAKLELKGTDGFKIEPGEYPVVKLIWRIVSRLGRATIDEIADEVFLKWRWVRHRRQVKAWVQYCLRKGYLRRVGRDYEIGPREP